MGRVKIPLEARKIFELKANNEVIVLGDRERGIELIPVDAFWSARLLNPNTRIQKCAKK